MEHLVGNRSSWYNSDYGPHYMSDYPSEVSWGKREYGRCDCPCLRYVNRPRCHCGRCRCYNYPRFHYREGLVSGHYSNITDPRFFNGGEDEQIGSNINNITTRYYGTVDKNKIYPKFVPYNYYYIKRKVITPSCNVKK